MVPETRPNRCGVLSRVVGSQSGLRARGRALGQTSVEFLVLLGFMIVIFSSFLLLVRGMVLTNQADGERQALAAIGTIISNEVATAAKVNSGYARVFALPPKAGTADYTAELIGGTEVVISTQEFEHVVFLPMAIRVGGSNSGPIGIENLITKKDSIIEIQPLDEGGASCGNGVQDAGEECDFPWNQDKTCSEIDEKYTSGGDLTCSSCSWVTTNCDKCLDVCPDEESYCKNRDVCDELGCTAYTCANVTVCGNAKIEIGEACDNGTYQNGVQCTPPYGGTCTWCSHDCKTVITEIGPYCGDETVDAAYGEECDQSTVVASCDTWAFGGTREDAYIYGDVLCTGCHYDTTPCRSCADCGSLKSCFDGSSFEYACINNRCKAYCVLCVPECRECQGDVCEGFNDLACRACCGSCMVE